MSPLAEQVLARPDLTLDQKLEAYRLLGSAKAIVEDPAEAEKPFRLLLRARADFDLSAETPPKILAVFRKVQSEERALADQLREVERDRIISGLKLLGEPPNTARGGRPLPLSFRLRDPTSAVEVVRVPYRRQGTPAFSTLALERSAEGDWRGLIPAEFTSDEKGFQMEYYVETADTRGPLLRLGTEKAPLNLTVSAGTIAQARPPPRGASARPSRRRRRATASSSPPARWSTGRSSRSSARRASNSPRPPTAPSSPWASPPSPPRCWRR